MNKISLDNENMQCSTRAMRGAIHWLLPIAFSTFLVSSCSLSYYSPNVRTTSDRLLFQSIRKAENLAAGATILHSNDMWPGRATRYQLIRLRIVPDVDLGKVAFITTDNAPTGFNSFCKYQIRDDEISKGGYLLSDDDGLTDIHNGAGTTFLFHPTECPHILHIEFKQRADAFSFADAMYVIATTPSDRFAQAFAKRDDDFRATASTFRASPTKPVLSQDDQRLATQANDAFANHDQIRAVELYYQVLDDAPWWPAGHYNLALLLAGQSEFGDAVDEMKKYLELVPDAPDAQKAQQQIWVWQGRINQN